MSLFEHTVSVANIVCCTDIYINLKKAGKTSSALMIFVYQSEVSVLYQEPEKWCNLCYNYLAVCFGEEVGSAYISELLGSRIPARTGDCKHSDFG
jgi:hypothetical protein